MPAGQPGLFCFVRPRGLRPLRADGALLHPASTRRRMPAGAARTFCFVRPRGLRPLRADGALLHPASTSEVSLGSLESSLRQLKGPLARPEFPIGGPFGKEKIWIFTTCVLQTWQRPTLPRLETKYHQRWSVSRPSSEWDRVQPLRHNHQVGKAHVAREAVFVPRRRFCRLLRAEARKRDCASPVVRRPRGA